MLNLSGVKFGYTSSQWVLSDINLSIGGGDIVGLLGSNGAGKTTLVSLIAGLRNPQSGSILVDGDPARPGREDLALVPQEYAFYPRLSGRENLAFFAGIVGLKGRQAQARIEEVLSTCDLDGVQSRRAQTYSGGMKRRLNLAIALLQRPRLLILDEPTAGMDPSARQQLLTTLRVLNQQGLTILYTSHLLSEVESLCHSVAVMHGGIIVLHKQMHELREEARHSIRLQLPSPPPDSLRELARNENDNWWAFALPENGKPLSQLLRTLENADCKPLQIRYGGRSLESVFFDATRVANDTSGTAGVKQ
ncbi:ABC transporter ATP-binding protein [Marinimicrobium sp. ARAG 43.8]|uniref:ABC transporter ATP-binding protein n=1 Tax=Marinimicrobium sp. ARAG 43.8 TaxID=3418719 RepID=UPI003CF23B05